MAVDAHGMPVRMTLTAGTAADCTQALPLIDGINANCLMGDKAYDTNEIEEYCKRHGIVCVIPSKSNRIVQRDIDAALYALRHLVENAFLRLKQWRGIATRYAKKLSSVLANCQFAATLLWLK